jgi:hypothetical protein
MHFRAALVSLDAARAVTGLSTERLECMVEDGQILYPCFDLKPRKSKKRIVRVASLAVSRLADNIKAAPLDLDVFLQSILPPNVNPPASKLQALFLLSSDSVIRLVEDKSLDLVKGTAWHPGQGGSPRILRSSVLTFLKAREIGALN